MKVREFTEEGNQKFILLYDEIKQSVIKKGTIEKGYTAKLQNKIEVMLNDNNLSFELPNATDIKFQNFKNSFEFGRYIFQSLKNQSENKILYNQKLWNWLSLFFFNIVFHKKARGVSEHRYILSDSWFTRFRHLVRTPWYIFKVYGESGKLFLSSPTYTGSDYMEQFISHRLNENYIKSANICYQLYYDQKNQEPKSGWSKKYILSIFL